MPVLSKNEKVFKNYLNLPPELRMMVVDEMVPDNRCRFTRCSKLSRKEAIYSKNYIYGLRIVLFDDSIDIFFAHNKVKCFHEDYSMRFSDKNVRCCDSMSEELWKEDLENCTDWIQQAVEYCKTLLRLHQRTLRHLTIYNFEVELDDYNFGVENLKSFNNLEGLDVYRKVDIAHFLSKTMRPLKSISVCYHRENNTSEVIEKVCQITNLVYMNDLKLNNEQFLQLVASDVSISIGYLTEIDVCNFIQSWRNGKIGKKVRKYSWELKGSSFDVIALFRLLGLSYDDTEWIVNANITHCENTEKRAKLSYNHNVDRELVFKVWEEC